MCRSRSTLVESGVENPTLAYKIAVSQRKALLSSISSGASRFSASLAGAVQWTLAKAGRSDRRQAAFADWKVVYESISLADAAE
jgi:hypothetical protein